jgi:hypothetical protein
LKPQQQKPKVRLRGLRQNFYPNSFLTCDFSYRSDLFQSLRSIAK